MGTLMMVCFLFTAAVREKLMVDRDSEISATSLRVSLLCPVQSLYFILKRGKEEEGWRKEGGGRGKEGGGRGMKRGGRGMKRGGRVKEEGGRREREGKLRSRKSLGSNYGDHLIGTVFMTTLNWRYLPIFSC